MAPQVLRYHDFGITPINLRNWGKEGLLVLFLILPNRQRANFNSWVFFCTSDTKFAAQQLQAALLAVW